MSSTRKTTMKNRPSIIEEEDHKNKEVPDICLERTTVHYQDELLRCIGARVRICDSPCSRQACSFEKEQGACLLSLADPLSDWCHCLALLYKSGRSGHL